MPLLPSALPPKGEASHYGANNFLNLIALRQRGGERIETWQARNGSDGSSARSSGRCEEIGNERVLSILKAGSALKNLIARSAAFFLAYFSSSFYNERNGMMYPTVFQGGV